MSQNEISVTSGRRSDLRSELYAAKLPAGRSADDNMGSKRRRVDDSSTGIFTSQGSSYLSTTDAGGTSGPLHTSQWRSNVDDNRTYDSITSGSEDELTGAVGQLSLNEDEQVRYHGKASGLHLLGNKERFDRRNEGGIWWVILPSACPHCFSDFFTLGGSRKLVYGLRFPRVR